MEKDSKVLLHHTRLFLEEGQSQLAYEALERVEPENEEQRRECEYLRAWGYILDTRWDEAESTLKPLIRSMEEAIEENSEQGGQEIHRQRHALCLFYLGNAAVNLAHFEDASRHYMKCLRLLRDRRVQSPKWQPIRLRARYSLGMTYMERGLYPAARQQYEEALKFYREVFEPFHTDLKEDLAAIYYGLCDLNRKTGDLIDALENGEKALSLYKELREQRIMESRMHNLLGHICMRLDEFRDASDHFTDALAIASACNQPKMMMINYLALAMLRMNEGKLEDALDYCKIGLDFSNRFKDDLLTGIAYQRTGKVAQAVAERMEGEQKRLHMEDALYYFEQACNLLDKTQAHTHIAEAYGKRAEILEQLGRTQEAVACWRSAVKAQRGGVGATWD